jgi:hypothetical protein
MKTNPNKCARCGKERGDHLANTLHCPDGPRARAGCISFHPKNTFLPKPGAASHANENQL